MILKLREKNLTDLMLQY